MSFLKLFSVCGVLGIVMFWGISKSVVRQIPIQEISSFLKKPFNGLLLSSEGNKFLDTQFFVDLNLDGKDVGSIFAFYRPLVKGSIPPIHPILNPGL